MALNLRSLRVFSVVAQFNSFSQAAVTLSMTQPAVSRAVQELEREIGTVLIDRSRRALTLTEAGTLLYQHAQRLFADEKAAEIALEELQGLERGHLAIGASHTTGTYLLLPLLSHFHQRYPKIRLSLEIANTQTILERLKLQSLDVAFVEGPVRDADFVAEEWRTDRLVVIAPPNYPVAAGQPVSLALLAEQPYIQRESGSGTRETVESFFTQNGLTFNVVLELGSNQAVKQAVSAGLGISILSEATLELELAAHTLRILDVQDFDLTRTLSQVTMKDRPLSHSAAAFRALAERSSLD
jgi:DNA-binding transcriptional LysR family regulator